MSCEPLKRCSPVAALDRRRRRCFPALRLGRSVGYLLLSSFGHWQRGLGEHVAPACRSPQVCVTEPDCFIERLSVFCSFFCQQGGNDGGITPNTNCLISIVLSFVGDASTARFCEQVGFGKVFPAPVTRIKSSARIWFIVAASLPFTAAWY